MKGGGRPRPFSCLKVARRAADDSRVKRVPAPWLVAIVGASFLVRTIVGWLRTTPSLFPDEYIYAALGRSLADSGHPLIRGGSAHFPALLQPLVTAPAWLVGDVGVAFRLVQATEALAMSLAAVPVYLIARRLGLSQRIGLAVAALAVLVPDLVYSSFISSEALAYPLVLGAVAAGTSALARPTRRSQLAFVALAVLAAFARLQFAVLPVVFVLAVFAVGARERRVRAALREQLLPVGLFVLPLAVGLLVGTGRALGYYHGALGIRPDPLAMLRWMGLDAMAIAYASGWIIIPGALVGLSLALARPRDRRELAFASMAALLALALLAEAAVLQTNPSGFQASVAADSGIKERYVFYVVPLAGILFALYARRGWPGKVWHLAAAGALLVVSVRVPLSGFVATLSSSPILYGVSWLTKELGRPSSASTAVAATVGLLSVVAVAASGRPRLGTPLALGLALVATATASAGAVAFEVATTTHAKSAYLPADASFVDRAKLRHVALLVAENGTRSAAFQTLFWNRSIDRVLLLPGAEKFDVFASEDVTVTGDGSLLVNGRAIRSPLLVDGFGSTVRLRGARRIVSGPASTLWAPTGRLRLALYATGRYSDGWLSGRGSITVWPATKGAPVQGRLTMTLSVPADSKPVTIKFRLPGGRRTDVRVHPGVRPQIDLAACASGRWRATFRGQGLSFAGPRLVSVRATAPVFTPDPSACPDPQPAP